MKKSKLLLILILSVLAVLLCVGAVFAYFYATSEANSGTITLTADGTAYVEVTTFGALESACSDTYFNQQREISQSAERKVIRLNRDITLPRDLFISADCHIDFNGYKLLANGNSITIRHSFYGTFDIYDSSVSQTGGISYDSSTQNQPILFLDIINAYVITDFNFIDTNTDSITASVNASAPIEILANTASFNTYNAYNAFYYVAQTLTDEVTSVSNKLDYLSVAELSLTNNAFDLSTFLSVSPYISGNLDLPLSCYGSPITYTASSGIIDAYGQVTQNGTTSDVTLTASVTFGETTYTCAFTLKVLGTSDSAKNDASIDLFQRFISKFYSNEDSVYAINSEMLLPKTLADVTLTYAVYDSSSAVLDDTIFTAESGSNYVYLFVPIQAVDSLEVTFTIGGVTTNRDYPITSANTARVENNFTISQDLLLEWYSTQIDVYSSSASTSANGFTTQELYTDIPAKYTSIVSVEYSLMNNSDNIYGITDNAGELKLEVNLGADPALVVQSVLLNVKITFNDTAIVETQIPIVYSAGGGDDNASGFLPFYNYFNQMVLNTTGGYTYLTFEMPLMYGNGTPVILLDIKDASGAVGLSLSYNGTDYALVGASATDNSGYMSYVDSFESHGKTLTELLQLDAVLKVTIDLSAITPQNQSITLMYRYKFSLDDNTDFILYAPLDSENIPLEATSTFILPGVIHLGNGNAYDVESTVLYEWVYNSFNPLAGSSEPSATYTSGNLILTDWLAKDITYDESAISGTITSHKGMQFLQGTKNVKLTSVTASDIVDYISIMPSLASLDVSGCSLTDEESTAMWFTALSQSTTLQILNVSDNDIEVFDKLSAFAALSSVYLYDNISYGLDSIFYGSRGLYNIAVYQTLLQRGVKVYNLSLQGTPQLFEDDGSSNDYIALSSIEYQRKLPVGAEIDEVYSTLSTDYNDYGLSLTYSYYSDETTLTSVNSGSITNRTITFGIDSTQTLTTATSFYCRYQCTISGTNFTLTVYFTVERV